MIISSSAIKYHCENEKVRKTDLTCSNEALEDSFKQKNRKSRDTLPFSSTLDHGTAAICVAGAAGSLHSIGPLHQHVLSRRKYMLKLMKVGSVLA